MEIIYSTVGMLIIYFALGMLITFAVIFTASVIYNFVKLSKLNKQYRDIKDYIDSTQREIYRIEENISSYTNRKIDNIYSDLWRVNEENSKRLEKLQSYIDSRINDKLDSKNAKQQING